MKKSCLLLGSSILLLPFLAQSQNAILFSDTTQPTHLPSAIIFKDDSLPETGADKSKFFQSFLPLSASNELRLTSELKDENGMVHQFYGQFYKGIKIIDGQYILHTKNSRVLSMNGNFQPISNLSVIPSISEKEALTSALNDIKASIYKWQIKEEEILLQEQTGINDTSYFPKGALVIASNNLSQDKSNRLVYQFIIYSDKPFAKWLVYIDAQSGKLLYKENQIETANSPGTADTRYSGNQTFTTDSYSGGFRLRETRGAGNVPIQTYNMRLAGSNYGISTDYSDNNNIWTNAEYNNANNDNASLDAHWATEKVFDYFSQVRNRNSWNNAGASLLGYVNADLVTMGFDHSDNAFWDGSKMTYGRGTLYGPATSLDIVAHEIGHGVCQSSVSGGLGYSGEAGALNESLSDIWSACVKQWAAPSKPVWLIGSEVVPGGIRSMNNPNSIGQPDTYGGLYWITTSGCSASRPNDNCFVHNNNGVQNFWFYLLANGGTGTNDLSNAYSVAGVGITTAAAIVYQAEIGGYLFSGMNYAQARTAYIQAASALYGNNSCQVVNVTNAWYAVGVGAAYISSTMSISGNATICGAVTYTIANLPATATVTWNISTPSLVDFSCTSCSSTTISSRGSGTGNLNAVITNCGSTQTLTKSVSISGPSVTNLTATRYMGSQCITTGIKNIFVVSNPGGITTPVEIKSDNGATLYNSGSSTPSTVVTTAMFGIVASGPVSLLIRVQNSCGWSAWKSVFISLCSGGSFAISPNPANSMISISSKNSDYSVNEFSSPENISTFDAIEILDKSGMLKKQIAYASGISSTNINVSDLPSGIYFIKVLKGKIWESYEVIVTK